MSDPLAWIDEERRSREAAGLARHLVTYGSARPGFLEREGRSLVHFASNDYLGLAADPRVVAAACEAAATFGWGAGASPAVSGWRTPHHRLAEELAAFERCEAAALFPSGFSANAGAVASLVGPGDAVFVDRLDHACLVAGARLSGARLRVYPHREADRLAGFLARERARYRRVLIATDGVFSMDGDLAPLAELAGIAARHDAMLLVDEAHGTGVFGPDGRGACSACGVADAVPIRVGTLSKALGSIGGFVAGPSRLIDHLTATAPTFVYSTALPPAAAAAASEALAIARAESWRRVRCFDLGDRLRSGLRDRGFRVPDSTGPIVPVILGEPGPTLALRDRLLASGFLVAAIRPPTVPKGTSRLRISVTAAHGEAEVDALLDALPGVDPS